MHGKIGASRAGCSGRVMGPILVVVLLGAAAGAIFWGTRPRTPRVGLHVRSDLQSQIGVEIAEVTRGVVAASRGPVAVFALIGQKTGPYADQLAALTGALAESGIEVGVYDPRSIGLGNDVPYTHGYGLVLQRCSPGVLVGLVHGAVDVGPVPAELQEFMDKGGRLVVLGDLSAADGPFVEWIRQGKAVAVARNVGALQHLAPEERTLDPKTTPKRYFEQYYSVLTAENVEMKLRPKG